MGDVGGETFDRAHPLPQCVGHLAQGAGEIADFVSAPSEIRYLDPRATAARTLRCSSKAAYRADNRAREVEREQYCDQKCHAEDTQQLKSHGADFFLDLAAPGRKHDRAQHLLV